MSSNIRRIIYSSIASETTDFQTVLDILNQAVVSNRNYSVTGMLVFNGTYFLQYIEGNSEAVGNLFHNISHDRRHHSLTLIDDSIVEHRIFSAWNMGYVNRSDMIQEIVYEITGSFEFRPQHYSPDQTQTILKKLSYII